MHSKFIIVINDVSTVCEKGDKEKRKLFFKATLEPKKTFLFHVLRKSMSGTYEVPCVNRPVAVFLKTCTLPMLM